MNFSTDRRVVLTPARVRSGKRLVMHDVRQRRLLGPGIGVQDLRGPVIVLGHPPVHVPQVTAGRPAACR